MLDNGIWDDIGDEVNMPNLCDVYNSNADLFCDDQTESPFDICRNKCSYYEPISVHKMLSNPGNKLSLFCINCQ